MNKRIIMKHRLLLLQKQQQEPQPVPEPKKKAAKGSKSTEEILDNV